jgi:hypothetical protein
VGTKELQALIEVIQAELAAGRSGHVLGTWTIHYDKARAAFTFDKCEDGVYCEERPAVIALDQRVLDPGGPIGGPLPSPAAGG